MVEQEPSKMVRPVCHSLPSSVALWDDTNLPLSCVLTPLAELSISSALAEPKEYGPFLPLTAVPKCLHCGAPHPTTVSHYPFHNTLLCHLCGKTSSINFDDQAEHRREEPMDSESYGKTSPRGSSATSGQVIEFHLPMPLSISSPYSEYQLPAMNCPPLWWIVVEGSPSRHYWNVISSVLSSVIANLPPYVHIGLLMASSTTLSVWNVTSPVPLVQHFSWNMPMSSSSHHDDNLPLADVGTYQSHLQSALRAMGDSMVLSQGKMPLVPILERILDQLERGGKHPGQQPQERTTTTSSMNGTTKSHGHHRDDPSKPYAGGRILMLLNGPPQELGGDNGSMAPTNLPRQTGMGGQGGAAFESGCRFSSNMPDDANPTVSAENHHDDDPEMGSIKLPHKPKSQQRGNSDDLTSKNLELNFPHVTKSLMQDFQRLGQKFAEAAFGVDILVLKQTQPQQHIGLALLKPLCEATGAPGPLIFDSTKPNIEHILHNEIWSRRPVNFGGLLRVRLSPGFKVDTSPVEGATKSHLELAYMHVRKGLMGPATATKEESLWQVGCCDAHQTMTLDLQVTNKIKRFAFVDGLGEVALKPCLQVCFAYTTVVPSEENPDEFVTVRRMRICTLHLPMVNDVESLFAALDPEALAVVLFHKFALSALTEGITETQEICRSWLKFILVCTYRSAEEASKRQKSKAAQGLDTDEMFYPSERLLTAESSLARDDILLGQGHDILRLLPLLVWCMLQCDAMRPSSDTYKPTLDSRSAALMQMSSMSPLVLARCIAPRLELWESGNETEEPILTTMGLSFDDVKSQLLEYQQADPNLILFLDSPFGIVVCDSRHVQAVDGLSNPVVVGEALQRAVQHAVDSYRSPPPVTWALDTKVPVGHVWNDFMVEDALTATLRQNFVEWKRDLAASIFDEVANNADY